MLYTKGLLSAAAGITEQSASGKAIGVDELQKVMNSSASGRKMKRKKPQSTGSNRVMQKSGM